MRIRLAQALALSLVVWLWQGDSSYLQWRRLLGLGEVASIVAILVGLIELGLREVLLVYKVVEHFR